MSDCPGAQVYWIGGPPDAGKTAWRYGTTDPDLALRHHIARDLLLAAAYRREVRASHVAWIEITGADEVTTIARAVSRHFGLE